MRTKDTRPNRAQQQTAAGRQLGCWMKEDTMTHLEPGDRKHVDAEGWIGPR